MFKLSEKRRKREIQMNDKTKESTFGKGCAYCLGMFLAHENSIQIWEQSETEFGKIYKYSMVIYAAADHLYELKIPDWFPIEIKKRFEIFLDCAFKYRLPMKNEDYPTKENFR